MKIKLLTLSLLCVLPLLAVAQKTYEDTITDPPNGIVKGGAVTGNFRLWVPEGDVPRYVLLMFIASSKDADTGIDLDELAPEWRSFAQEQHLAVLTCRFAFGAKRDNSGYGYAEKKTLDELRKLSDKAGNLGLTRLPSLLLWTHDTGMDMTYSSLAQAPERVVAAATDGKFSDSGDPVYVHWWYKIPCLFTVADAVGTRDLRQVAEAVKAARGRSVPWCLAPDRYKQPSSERRRLIQAFFAAVIARHKSGMEDYWVGSLKDKTITEVNATPAKGNLTIATAKANRASANDKNTVWLPDEDFAHAWQLFVGDGSE
jgi:hypothetical protein